MPRCKANTNLRLDKPSLAVASKLKNGSINTPFSERNLHTISRSGINKDKNVATYSNVFKRNSLRNSIRSSLAKLLTVGIKDAKTSKINYLNDEACIFDPLVYAKLLINESSSNDSDEKQKDLKKRINNQLERLDALKNSMESREYAERCLEEIIGKKQLEAFVEELLELRNRGKTPTVISSMFSNTPPRQRISITGLSLPMVWRKMEGFLGKHDDSRCFDVFCLLRVKSDIQATEICYDVDSSVHDLVFKDVFIFKNVDDKFRCTLEIYARKRSPNEMKTFGTSTLLRQRFKKRETLSSLPMKMTGNQFGSNDYQEFQLLATGNLCLDDILSSKSCFDLVMNNSCNESMPLFGQFCCTLTSSHGDEESIQDNDDDDDDDVATDNCEQWKSGILSVMSKEPTLQPSMSYHCELTPNAFSLRSAAPTKPNQAPCFVLNISQDMEVGALEEGMLGNWKIRGFSLSSPSLVCPLFLSSSSANDEKTEADDIQRWRDVFINNINSYDPSSPMTKILNRLKVPASADGTE